MHKVMRLARFAGYCFLAVATLVLSYLAIAWMFLLFPGNRDFKTSVATSQNESTVRVYVLNNGVHTDLVLPVNANALDWQTIFPKNQFVHVAKTANLIAFGWGDAEFYLHTPSWSDLKLSTAVRALVGANPALLHVEYLQTEQLPGQLFAVDLSPSQYRALGDYILRSMTPSENGMYLASDSGYGQSDAFFNAIGSYSAVRTCNTWTGLALAHAGVKVSRWTPFPVLVTWYLPEISAPHR